MTLPLLSSKSERKAASLSSNDSNSTLCRALRKHAAPSLQISRLAQEEEKLNRDISRSIEAHIASCRLAVCEEMQTRLPREVRDLIYTHLILSMRSKCQRYEHTDISCTCPTNHYSGGFYNGVKDEAARSKPPCMKLKDEKLLAYTPDTIDSETHRELAEAWFSNGGLYWVRWRLLGPFLANDVWHAGLDPKEHVRALTTAVYASEFVARSDGNRKGSKQDTIELLIDTLHGSRDMEKGSFFCLRVQFYNYISGVCTRGADFLAGLEAVFAVLGLLQKDGVNVLVYPEGLRASQALQSFCGPVPSVQEWLSRAYEYQGMNLLTWQDLEGLPTARQDRVWYELMPVKVSPCMRNYSC
jgi:hypothetical protein